MRLARAASPEVPVGAVLVVPVGSTEQHGPHLPLGTDTTIAGHLAERLVGDAALPGVSAGFGVPFVLAPALPYGAAGEHAGFAGSLSIGHQALELLLIELVRSAVGPRSAGFRGVVLVNGHGGQAVTLQRVARWCTAEGRPVLAWSPRLPVGGDPHAGRTETSVLLALDPEAVRTDVSVTPVPIGDAASLYVRIREEGIAAVSRDGVLGDPSGARAEDGLMLLTQWAHDLTSDVLAWLATIAAAR